MAGTTTATVETLTAEVRVLAVGSRQITLSVAKQLDDIPWEDLEPMGRVNLGIKYRRGETEFLDVIGRDCETGALARTTVMHPGSLTEADEARFSKDHLAQMWRRLDEVWALPLIVLAGLK